MALFALAMFTIINLVTKFYHFTLLTFWSHCAHAHVCITGSKHAFCMIFTSCDRCALNLGINFCVSYLDPTKAYITCSLSYIHWPVKHKMIFNQHIYIYSWLYTNIIFTRIAYFYWTYLFTWLSNTSWRQIWGE